MDFVWLTNLIFFDKYGFEYSDDKKTLVRCPKDFEGEYIIPDSVTSIENDAINDGTKQYIFDVIGEVLNRL